MLALSRELAEAFRLKRKANTIGSKKPTYNIYVGFLLEKRYAK
jgi:hypothetical protein